MTALVPAAGPASPRPMGPIAGQPQDRLRITGFATRSAANEDAPSEKAQSLLVMRRKRHKRRILRS